MRTCLPKFFFPLLLFITGCFYGLQAQVITAGPDSVEVQQRPSPKDTIPFYRVDLWSEPGKAALLSGLVPGLGQAYNKSYWKIPVLYVGGGVIGYFLLSHHKNYLQYRTGIKIRTDSDSTNNVDQFTERLAARSPADQIALLKKGRNQYRRWRDQTILLSIVAYTINVTEAYVYAHLKDFDISDDLSMRVHPDFIQVAPYKFSPALTISINLRNNAHSSNRIR